MPAAIDGNRHTRQLKIGQIVGGVAGQRVQDFGDFSWGGAPGWFAK